MFVTNPDGTPWYANIHAASSLTITISEAYNLAGQVRDMARVLTKMADDDQHPLEMRRDCYRQAQTLEQRAVDIERTCTKDKEAQFDARS